MSFKLICLTGTLVVVGLVADAGLITVKVHEKHQDGANVNLYVPAILVPIGMKFVPDAELRRAAEQSKDFLPAMRAAARELARIPDGPLVEVRNSREQVSVVKSGGSLIVDVNSSEETVHVGVPLKMVEDLVRELERRNPSS